MSAKQIPINIIQSDGDPDLLKFFDQIRSCAEINKYNPQMTIAILKGKLVGPAQKFLVQNPELQKFNDLDTL